LRIFALKPSVFFSRKGWFNSVDFVVVTLTFVISVAYAFIVAQIEANEDECWPDEDSRKAVTYLRALVILRFVRFVRLIRMIRLYTEHHMIKRAVRQTVSQVS